ncbi:hypothetical protein CWB98_23180 [Pseudoalteromonas rubra]|uniref:Uncharacterized protein n=1 Tax=Pseudoalteromonas rubra TaxID=43658 RepID=A0A5S3WQ39_9GAMM|nr:hypothetical protein CWB98_23180 [Pseudoalteromonas rubra]
MKLKSKYKILALATLSVFAALIAYGFLSLSLSFELTLTLVFVGLASGFTAMKLCGNKIGKWLLGVPTALNSIVFLYFCSPLVLGIF